MSSPSHRTDDEEEEELAEELDRRASEAIEEGVFIPFEEHAEDRDD